MVTLTDIALGVLLPAIVTFLVLACVGRWWRGREAPTLPDWAWPLALGVGYLAGHFSMTVVPNVLVGSPIGAQLTDYALPVTVEGRAGWIVLLLCAVAMVEARWDRSLWLRWALRIAAVSFAIWLLTHPAFRSADESHELAQAIATAIVFTMGMLVLWALASDRAADQPSTTRLDTTLIVATTGSAAILAGLADSQKLAQFLGALAVAQTVLWAVQLLNHRDTRLTPVAGPMVVATIWLALTAHLYAGLTGFNAIAIALALAFAACPALTANFTTSPRVQQALRIVLITLLLASALTAAGLQFSHDWNDNSGSEWDEGW